MCTAVPMIASEEGASTVPIVPDATAGTGAGGEAGAGADTGAGE
jgi:hypothetical protein